MRRKRSGHLERVAEGYAIIVLPHVSFDMLVDVSVRLGRCDVLLPLKSVGVR